MKEWVMSTPETGTWFDKLVSERGLNLEFDYETQLHDPFLMQDMDKAVKRLSRAIERGEKLMIFADYDADGVPGAATLAIFLRKIGFHNFLVYLPDRHIEDYGLSMVSIDQASAEGVKLLLTIDCGIANAKEVAYANSLGIEVIITDHHLVPAEIPKAVAVLDPKREDCAYPYKQLCGAGVVFKLIQALALQNASLFGSSEKISRTQNKMHSVALATGWEKWLLDLIAIATVSDMVPLTGENRALVHYGLKVLRKSPRPGVVELCRVLRLKQEKLTEDDIAFSIGPRLNAASRMAHASEAFELLTTEDVARAVVIARRLENLNKERRKCVEQILEQVGTSREATLLSPSPLLVVGHESWSLGVLGLTASRLVEQYARPVFVWGKNGHGMIKGSCRSDGTINVVELMRGVEGDFFLNIGGHHQAGGFSLAGEKVGELEPRLLQAFATLDKQIIEDKLIIDAELELDEVTPPFYCELSRLAPFGIGNPKPIFLFSQVEIVELKEFGNGGAHLELGLRNQSGKRIKAISFFDTYRHYHLGSGQKIDLVATVEESFFGHYPSLRLRIVDLRSP